MTKAHSLQLDRATRMAVGLDHPECVTVGSDGQVYAGGEAGQIYRLTDTGEAIVIAETGGFVLGICVDADATVFACDLKRREVLAIAEGRVEVLIGAEAGLVTPNHLVLDHRGRLYVTDSGTYRQNDGRIIALDLDGTLTTLQVGVSQFPNGIALDPTGSWLYVVLSTLPGVARVPLVQGKPSGPVEIVAVLDRTVPDGLAFDANANLYVSCYTPDRIYLIDPSGAVEVALEDWESDTISAPTNIAFGGADGRDLLIANLGRWHITSIRVPVAGAPLRYPIGPRPPGGPEARFR